MKTLIIKTQEDIDQYRKSGDVCSLDLTKWEGLDIQMSNLTVYHCYMENSTFHNFIYQYKCTFKGCVYQNKSTFKGKFTQYKCIFKDNVYQHNSIFKGKFTQSHSTFEEYVNQSNCTFKGKVYQNNSTFKAYVNQSNSIFEQDSTNCTTDQSKDEHIDKLKSDVNSLETPSYYDNTKGSIFKLGIDRGWNGYVIDIVKRLERAEDKGEFLSDIDKAINTLKLYKEEQGHRFNNETEILNKKI